MERIDSIESLNNQALSYIDIGMPEKAEECWEKINSINAVHVEAAYNNIIYLWKCGRVSDTDVEKTLKRVYSSNGKSDRAGYLLAQFYAERGDYKEAGSLLEKISSLDTFYDAKQLSVFVNSQAPAHVWHTKDERYRIIENIDDIWVSPDKKRVITFEREKYAKMWDVESGKCLYEFRELGKALRICVSDDWKYMAAIGCIDESVSYRQLDYNVYLMNLEDKRISELKGSSRGMSAAFFTANGLILFAVTWGGQIMIWSVQTGFRLKTWDCGYEAHSACLSPDESKMLIGGKNELMLFNPYSGECLCKFDRQWFKSKGIGSVSFSPDGAYALSGEGHFLESYEKQLMRLWDVETGEYLRTYPESGNIVSFCSNGKYAFSRPDISTTVVKLWDVFTGKCIKTFQGGRTFYTSEDTDYVYVTFPWGATPDIFPVNVSQYSCKWAPSLTVSTQQQFTEPINTVEHDSYISGMHFCRQIKKGKNIHLFEYTKAFNNGILFYTGQAVWDVKTHEPISFLSLPPRTDWLRNFCFMADGKSAFTLEPIFDKYIREEDDNSETLQLKRWNIASGKGTVLFRDCKEDIMSMDICPNDKYVILATFNGDLLLMELQTEKMIIRKNGGRYLNKALFHPDGDKIVVITSKDISLWDIQFEHMIWMYETSYSLANKVEIRFSPDHKLLLVYWLYKEKTVELRDTRTGKLIVELQDKEEITDAVFCKDGKHVISYGEQKIKFWGIESGECIFSQDMGCEVKFLSEGDYALTEDGLVEFNYKYEYFE